MSAQPANLEASWSQVRAAIAKSPVDLLVRDCRIVNVYSGELHSGDIAVKDGVFVAIRERFSGEARLTLDGGGRIAAPGFVASASIPPGLSGPADSFSGLLEGVTSVVHGEGQVPDLGPTAPPLRMWACRSGAAPLLTCGSLSEVAESLRLGRPAFLFSPKGTASLHEVLGAFARGRLDSARVSLGRLPGAGTPSESVSEPAAETVRAAIRAGMSLAQSFSMATLNPAIVYSLDHRVGSISPGRCADFLLFDDAEAMGPATSYIGGIPIANWEGPGAKAP